jgi:hypothetical protein
MALITLLCALAMASAASAGDNAGLAMTAGSISGSAKYVTFVVKLTSDANQPGPGTSVEFTDCRAGLGLPLPVEPSSFVKPPGSSLYANKLGNVQWNVDHVPPHGTMPLTLTLTYEIPHHSRPYSVCLRASALQNVSGIRLGWNMRFFLHAAKKQ